MLFDVYSCVQVNRWSVVCGCVLHRGSEGRCGVFRRLCVSMILGWDFYWSELGEGATCFSGEGEFGRGDLGGVLMYELGLRLLCRHYHHVIKLVFSIFPRISFLYR